MDASDDVLIELLATVVGLAIGAAILLGTGIGRRWVAWNRSQLPPGLSAGRSAATTGVGAVVAFAVLHLIRYGATPDGSFLLNAAVATVGITGIVYLAMRRQDQGGAGE